MLILRTLVCLSVGVYLYAQAPPPKLMDAPAYALANGTTWDMSRGKAIMPTTMTPGFVLPSACTAGTVQVTTSGFFFCGSSGSWLQLPGLTNGKLPVSVIPNLESLGGTLINTQLPATLTANTSGNAATATALAAVPTQAPSGRYCTGIAANGGCNAAQVQWSQLGGAPSFVLSSSVGQAAGVAALGADGKIPLTQIPAIPYASLAGSPTLGSIASHNTTDFLPSSTVIPTDLSQLANSPGYILSSAVSAAGKSGRYADLTGLPVLGAASSHPATDFISSALLGVADGVATLDHGGKVALGLLPTIPSTQVSGLGTAAAADATAFVAVSTRGAAGGVATLDSSSLLTASQIPAVPWTKLTSVPGLVLSSSVGLANGVASLGNDGKVPVSQIPTTTLLGTTTTPGILQVGAGLSVTGGVVSLNASAVDAAGAAAAVQAASLQKSANLSDVANSGIARTNLGLGTAATHAAGDYIADPGTNGVAFRTGAGASRLLLGSDLTAILGYTPVDTAARNSNNGFAGLDAAGKVSVANLPTIPWSQIGSAPSFVLSSAIGAVNGVAGLDATGKVPTSQLPATVIASATALGSVRIPGSSELAVSGTGDLTVKSNTFDAFGAATAAVAAIPTASGTVSGILNSADWSTFNSKQSALGFSPQNVAQKGVANGYAGLGGTGTVPTGQLPLATANTVGVVKPGANMTVGVDGSLSVATPYSLPPSTAGSLGGVRSYTAPDHQFFTGLSTLGIFTSAQPTTSDIAGLGTIAGAAATDYIRTSAIGQANGVPSLSSVGLIPKAQLPLNGPQQILVNNSQQVVRPKLNFSTGSGVTLTAIDDGSSTTTIQIASTGGGTGSATDASQLSTGTLPVGRLPAFTGGDVTSSAGTAALNLSTVNTSPGVCGDATHVCRVTTDGKGRVTTQSSVAITGTSNAGGGLPPTAYPFSAATSVAMAHNLNTFNVLVGCRDNSTPSHAIEYGRLDFDNANQVTAYFSSPVTGSCTVNGGVGPQGPTGATGSGSTIGVQSNTGALATANTVRFSDSPSVTWTASTVSGTTTVSANATASGTGTVTHSAGSLTANQLILGNGTGDIKTGNLTGDVTTAGTTATTLSSVNGNVGTFGSSTTVPVITVDAKGRITSVTTASVSGGSGGTTGSGVAKGALSAIPGTCTSGDLYFATDAPTGQQLYECSASNSWNQYTVLGGSGALAYTNGALDVTSQVPRTAASAAITGAWSFSNLQLANQNTPSSSSAACSTGQVQYDTSFVYICIATNTWRRAALAAW